MRKRKKMEFDAVPVQQVSVWDTVEFTHKISFCYWDLDDKEALKKNMLEIAKARIDSLVDRCIQI